MADLEDERLMDLRGELDQAVARSRRAGVTPADVVACLGHTLGVTLAEAGIDQLGASVLAGVADCVRTGHADGRRRIAREQAARVHAQQSARHVAGGARRGRRPF